MSTTANTDPLLDAVRGGVRIYDLGRPLFAGMPQSPNHPAYTHTLPRRHGDKVRPDGGSAANDLIFMGTHVGTHIDALAHVSQDGRLHGGADAAQACVGGRYPEHGV
ncbi:cyclase family protein, partial [Nonomuraea fuscirosea]